MDTEQTLQSAIDFHRNGNLPEAERLYRAVLAAEPGNSDTWCLLGGLVNQAGRPNEAIDLIQRAISIEPLPEYYVDLAGPYLALGDRERAIETVRQAVTIDPEWAEAQAQLGTLLQSVGRFEDSVDCFEKAITIEGDHALWHLQLGNALLNLERYEPAIAAMTRSLELEPNHAGALNNLGHALYKSERFDAAADVLRRALAMDPGSSAALHNLGCVRFAQERYEESVEVLRRAIAADPKAAIAYKDLGISLRRLGRYAEAIDAYRRALALNPQWADVLCHMSLVQADAGDAEGAATSARQAQELSPGLYIARQALANALSYQDDDRAIELFAGLVAEDPGDSKALNSYAHDLRTVGRYNEAFAALHEASKAKPDEFRPGSNYLFMQQFQEENPARIVQAARDWGQRHIAPLAKEIVPLANDRRADRRLRIGYVSPDFRHHCQALFTSALLPHHDHEQFEIFCYSAATKPDAVTWRLQQFADTWRNIGPLSDVDAANLIRADGIDILVDLTMHMRSSRPLLFARKPAPIQVAWLAYPGTTGLPTMDYRLTDPYLDPQGFDGRYVEKSVRLAETFWCYDAHGMRLSDAEQLPEINELPALKNKFVTFGCLNDFGKLNAATLRRWGRLMQRMPNSRIHLLARPGQARELVLRELASIGIAADRVTFVARQGRAAYLAEYHRIDLCLDTLPYNGHTTSLDAFWMGVPVLTQIGPTVVGRAGFSQLANLQLDDLCADDDARFVELGVRWGSDLSGLADLRRTLRDRMVASPLMNGALFASRMEAAFRQMWRAFATI